MAMLCGAGPAGCGDQSSCADRTMSRAPAIWSAAHRLSEISEVTNPEVVKKFEDAWGVSLSDKIRITLPTYRRSHSWRDQNPVHLRRRSEVTDADTNHIIKALKAWIFSSFRNSFMTETAQYADVILPEHELRGKSRNLFQYRSLVQRVQLWISQMIRLSTHPFRRGYHHRSDESYGRYPGQTPARDHGRKSHSDAEFPGNQPLRLDSAEVGGKKVSSGLVCHGTSRNADHAYRKSLPGVWAGCIRRFIHKIGLNCRMKSHRCT